jgi:hypothetical protein
MLAEIQSLNTDEDLLAWARDGLARKNTLLEADARAIEMVYQRKLRETTLSDSDVAEEGSNTRPSITHGISDATTVDLTYSKEPVRKRSKAHLSFVRGQPCVVCKQSPCDPHHLKFARPRALGRKVSDEFTVPLCRAHHQQLHCHGNEKAWWANLQIAPLLIAKQLWDASPIHATGTGPANDVDLHDDLSSESAAR